MIIYVICVVHLSKVSKHSRLFLINMKVRPKLYSFGRVTSSWKLMFFISMKYRLMCNYNRRVLLMETLRVNVDIYFDLTRNNCRKCNYIYRNTVSPVAGIEPATLRFQLQTERPVVEL